ncbi:SGNH/GDSL hydrolase family protein [Microvirga massiliensis]|uniref:SGNH/GDSL hydrolase family protein n=1 Tax=Microvirga massiliensis TaxID=1033741 RepID=UPI00062B4877|nr:SGNH/GDSL hydrolase family protein [Microvirga massiliensis]
MAFPFPQVIAFALILPLSAASAAAQISQQNMPSGTSAAGADVLDGSLSPECRAPADELYRVADLKRVAAILAERRPLKVLALGASGGEIGAGPASPTYGSRLEEELRNVLSTRYVDVEARGIPGEMASDAPEHIENAVTEIRPDLLVWKVGLHDALARTEIEPFATSVRELVDWLHSHEIDVILIDPPYTAAVAGDGYYESLVGAIRDVALRTGTPLVLRFSALRFLSQQKTDAARNQFLLQELGRRCVPEYVARVIALSIGGSNPPSPRARAP